MVRICGHTGKKAPGGRQTLVVSATLTERVLQMAETWCPQAKQVFIGGASAESIAADAELAAAEEAAAVQRRSAAAAAAAAAAAGEPGADGPEAAAAAAAAASAAAAADSRRPSWGWGDAKSPSADAPDYNPGTSSAGGLGSEQAASSSLPPHLTHHFISSAPQHKVDTLR
jgi:hypothetical protein